MKVYTLTNYLRSLNLQPRLYFQSKIPNRAAIIDELNRMRSDIAIYLAGSHAALNIAPVNVVDIYDNENSSSKCVHLVRFKDGYRFICDYEEPHLNYSLTINYMFNNTYSMRERLDAIVFTWYYYIFLKTNKKMPEIIHNVCFQIEEMIKNIIQKELTVYRDFNTAEAITALRQRLANERLGNMGEPKGINIRRL